MKRLLLLSLLVVVALPATAQATQPCRNKIFNDWYADGKIASTYPHACYVDALHHLPTDAAVYSSLGDDITMAMRAAASRAAGKPEPLQVGGGFTKTAQNVLVSVHPKGHDPSLNEKTASGGIVATASSAPVPILVLAGLALALVAAGGIGAGVKFARSRRGG